MVKRMPRIDKVILTTSACVVALLFLVGCTATRTITQSVPVWHGTTRDACSTTSYAEINTPWQLADVDLVVRAKSDDAGTSVTCEAKTTRASETSMWNWTIGEIELGIVACVSYF